MVAAALFDFLKRHRAKFCTPIISILDPFELISVDNTLISTLRKIPVDYSHF